MTALFTQIDYASAQNVALLAGDASLTLKGDPDTAAAYDTTISSNDETDSAAESAESTENQTGGNASDAMTYAYHTPLYFAKEDHAVLNFNDIDYQITHVFFLDTGTEIGLCYDADSDEGAVMRDALTLIIDGEAYSCNPDTCYTGFETEEQSVTGKRGYVNLIFPAFSFDAARSVVLSVGDASYTLK